MPRSKTELLNASRFLWVLEKQITYSLKLLKLSPSETCEKTLIIMLFSIFYKKVKKDHKVESTKKLRLVKFNEFHFKFIAL